MKVLVLKYVFILCYGYMIQHELLSISLVKCLLHCDYLKYVPTCADVAKEVAIALLEFWSDT